MATILQFFAVMRAYMLRFVSFLADWPARWLLVGLCAVFLLRRREHGQAVLLVATVGGTGAANSLLKRLVDRSRPHHPFGLGQRSPSFPSGHTSGAAAFGTILCLLRWRSRHDPAMTATGLLLASLWTGLVGYSRVALGRHHPGDVLGGALLGALAATVSTVVVRSRERHFHNEGP